MTVNKVNTSAVVCPSCGGVYLSVPGEPASKANSRKIANVHGIRRVVKSNKALSLERMWQFLCPKLSRLLDGDLTVNIWLYYASRRPDLDESLVLDLLQHRVYKNDRQVREKHVYHRLDPAAPRSEVLVTPLAGCSGCPDGGCLRTRLEARASEDSPGAGVDET